MRIHQLHTLYQARLERSTKPFNARGAKVKRCSYCQVAIPHCTCAYQPDVESELATMIIMSDNEILKPSNTGRLIADVVKETYGFEWSRTEPNEDMLAILADEKYQPVIIFPEEYVENANRLVTSFKQSTSLFNAKKKPLLIFLDGSWREARKMFRKSPYLENLPVFSVNPRVVSQYIMRKSENENHLATAEVASLVIGEAGEPNVANVLASWFDVFNEGYMLSKTRIKPDLSKPCLTAYIENGFKQPTDK